MLFIPWEVCFMDNPVTWLAIYIVLCLLLLVVSAYLLVVTKAKPQARRPKKHQRRYHKDHARGFDLLQPSQPLQSRCPLGHPEVDAVCKIVQEFNRIVKDLTRYLDREELEDSDSSWASSTASDVESSSSERSLNITVLGNADQEDTLEGFVPEMSGWPELDLPAHVAVADEDVPASAPPPPQEPQEPAVTVVPTVPDLPFVDEAVKEELERLIQNMKIQKRYGLNMRILERSENTYL